MLRSSAIRALLIRDLPNLSKQNTLILPKCYSVSASAATATADSDTSYQTVEYANAKPYDSIPGPPAYPIIGNAWRFIGGVDFLKICKE